MGKAHRLLPIVCTFILIFNIVGCNDELKNELNNSQLPNVVFIFTDDLGYGDLTCYNKNSKIFTPNIDKLASEGMMFTDAHTSSAVCTPSRYSLLTGRYCWKTEHKRGVQGGYGLPLIEHGRMTLGNLFQENGYKTAAIGKWHVGMEWTLKKGYSQQDQDEETVDHMAPLKITPLNQGFDYYFGTSGCTSDDSPFCFIENRSVLGNPLLRRKGLNVVGDGDFIKDVLMTKDWEHEKADTTFTNKSIEFMKRQVANENPFFIYLAFSLPHIPWLPAEFVKGTTGAGPRGDLVALADYCLKEIEKALNELNIKENTIVVFSSDNGPRQGINGHQSAGKLRGYKGQIYEGGHRVPLIIRWPNKIKSNSISDETVCMTDFMRTFASILNYKLPVNVAEDSYDLSPLLFSKNYSKPLREFTVHHSGAGAFAIRKGDWKIIFGNVENGEVPEHPSLWKERGYLFNLIEDPYEKHNIYKDHPRIVTEMNALLSYHVSNYLNNVN